MVLNLRAQSNQPLAQISYTDQESSALGTQRWGWVRGSGRNSQNIKIHQHPLADFRQQLINNCIFN